MGVLDFFLLGTTIPILLISLFLLIFSLKSTEDEVKQRSYRRTYMPIITLSTMVLISYVMLLTIGDIAMSLVK